MKKFVLNAAGALCILSNMHLVSASAQCSNGRCFVPARHSANSLACAAGSGSSLACAAGSPSYEWRTRDDDPERRYLYSQDGCIGAYDVKLDYYRPFDAATQTWGACCQPPWDINGQSTTRAWQAPGNNYGVDISKLGSREKYTLHTTTGSHQLSREAAQGLVGAQLADDSNKLRVTVIGPDDKQKQVAADLARLVADLGSWAIVRAYSAEHWSVRPGFVKSGSPTIYCQAPGGKVLHRQDDYEGGGEALVDALRKAKASYDPKKDQDLRASKQDVDLSQTVTYGLAAALGVGACQLLRKRKEGGQ